jgi:hypothetical protein
MQTLVGLTSEDGKVLMNVDFEDEVDGHTHKAFLNVWVPDLDSRAELDKLAVAEARRFLERILSARDD